MFSRVLRNNKAASSLLAVPSQQVRRLNLHEYQSLDIMKTFGVATPQGIPAHTPAEAEAAFNKIKGGRCKSRMLYSCLGRARWCTIEDSCGADDRVIPLCVVGCAQRVLTL